MDKSQSQSGGVGCLGVLAIVFVTLKLTGNIAWSWTWVLAPLWIPIGLVILLILVAALVSWRR